MVRHNDFKSRTTMRSDLDGIKLCQGRFFLYWARILPFVFARTITNDYQAIFHSSMRRVLVEKLTPILKSLRGSAVKGRA